MGLLDELAGQVLGSLAGGNTGAGTGQNPLLSIIAALLGGQQGGGLGGLGGSGGLAGLMAMPFSRRLAISPSR